MDNETKLKVEESIVEMLKTVYDPEIPDTDCSQLYGCRLYYGGYPPENRIGRRCESCSN